MKSKIFYFLTCLILLTGCIKHEMPEYQSVTKDQVTENARRIFGVDFDKNHDWSTTSQGEVKITGIPSNIDKVQLSVLVEETDTTTSLFILNEAAANGNSSISLKYDAPSDNLGLFVSFISATSFKVVQVNGNTVDFSEKAATRNTYTDYSIPSIEPVISEDVTESFASQRKWITGQVLYEPKNIETLTMAAQDYSEAYKAVFRGIIFSYFKNGRQYNNLPLIKESGIYNDNAYPFTTGKEPIVVSPVYKSDKADKYGNEIWNSDLYYYYYKESDAAGKDMVQFLDALPKYKAIVFQNHFGYNEDDVISKRNAYCLIYWGDGTPTPGTTKGSFLFPEGYKIGFMVRAKTDFAEGNPPKPRKQGELYADGRLNYKINSWENFKSSKLASDAPRAGWITVGDRMLLCFESGTDSDFNDIILEVEGGVKPIINIPEFENNYYTFCFEDTELGDYDLNDVVIKASRINETTVEYSVVACGAKDELKIMNINGNKINSNTEVHKLFGLDGGYINTNEHNAEPVTERISVPKTFSFLDENTQPYIYDMTTDVTIKLSKTGEDPHGIMIPYDFKYPIEKICVKDAYPEFNSWGTNKVTSTHWYKNPIEELTF